jgi:hypothetical protein
MNIEKYSSEELIETGSTGEQEKSKETYTIIYPFGKYEVTIRLSSSNEFLGVEEVKINKSFIDYQRLATTGDFHDVEEFYKD